MFRRTAAAVATIAAATTLALAAPAQASSATILDGLNSQDRFTSTERGGLDVFRWDQRNWYDYDILTAAVVANGSLVGAVTSPETEATLFAPNDRAFQLLAKDLTGKWYFTEKAVLGAIVAKVGTGDALTRVLTYHVVGGKFLKAQVPLKTDIPTLNAGQTVRLVPNAFGIEVRDNVAAFRNPYLVRTDIPAGSSVIHSISRVLIPTNL